MAAADVGDIPFGTDRACQERSRTQRRNCLDFRTREDVGDQ